MTPEENVDAVLTAMDQGAVMLMQDLGESPEAMRGALVVCNAVISLAEHFRHKAFEANENTRHVSTNISVLALLAQLSQRIKDVTP